MQLEAALRTHGYPGSPDEFRTTLLQLLAERHPGWTDERLTCNPAQAQAYCDAVRCHFALIRPDELVLRALTNIRRARRRLSRPTETAP